MEFSKNSCDIGCAKPSKDRQDIETYTHPNLINCTGVTTSNEKNVGGWRAAGLILSMELCERLATLGIGLNLVTYLHDQMHLTIPRSANMVTNFLGTSYITYLLGGFIADTFLGRYGTIMVGSLVQLCGITLITLSTLIPSLKPSPCNDNVPTTTLTCKPPSFEQMMILYIALYMIAFGTGGIKSSVSGLGADQFQESELSGRKQMQSFFNWFGFGISMASTLAVTVLVYVQDNGGRGVGYAICAICMTIAFILFLLGSKSYRRKPPCGSPLTRIAHVFVAAWHNRSLPLPPLNTSSPLLFYHHRHHHIQYQPEYFSPQPNEAYNFDDPIFQHTKQFLFLDKAALIPESKNKFELIQNPWRLCPLEDVEEVKKFLRLIPILATTIIFWTANAQMVTFSIEQGVTLQRSIGKNFQVPAASLAAFLQITMLLTIPLYDRVLVPLARKWRKNEYGITSLQRIGVGLVFSILSMIVASFVEKKRLRMAHHMIHTNSPPIVPMSFLYLAPQYALVGIGEAFAYIGQLDFFFTESPHSMRSLGTGLSLSTISFGFFLSSALVNCINRLTKHGADPGWLTNNLNNGRLDKFYMFLAFISLLSFIAYLICSYWYKYSHGWGKTTFCHENVSANEKVLPS